MNILNYWPVTITQSSLSSPDLSAARGPGPAEVVNPEWYLVEI